LFTIAIAVVVEIYVERNALKDVTIKYGKAAVKCSNLLVKGLYEGNN
jgi:hypothetical protein